MMLGKEVGEKVGTTVSIKTRNTGMTRKTRTETERMKMESEQFMKLVEDIRKQLSRGNYQMDMGDLPYTGQARNVAVDLWEKGWRPSASESYQCRIERREVERAYAHMFGVHWRLTTMVMSFPPDSREREAFAEAIDVVKNSMDRLRTCVDFWDDKEVEALKAEGYND